MTRDQALVGLAVAIAQADRVRRVDRDADLLAAHDRRVVKLRRELARLDYPPEDGSCRTGVRTSIS